MKFRWTIILAAVVLALSSCGSDLDPFDDAGPSKRGERQGVPGLHFDKLMILYSEGYNNLRDDLDNNINQLCQGYIRPPKMDYTPLFNQFERETGAERQPAGTLFDEEGNIAPDGRYTTPDRG